MLGQRREQVAEDREREREREGERSQRLTYGDVTGTRDRHQGGKTQKDECETLYFCERARAAFKVVGR